MSMKIKFKKFVEKVTHSYIFRALPRGVDLYYDITNNLPFYASGIIFDVGANIGQSAEKFMGWFPGAQIYCFEPAASAFAALQVKFSSAENVHCFQLALDVSKEHGKLHLYRDSLNNSLIVFNSDYERTENIETETISYFCRNRNIDRINLLKIDTEGYDLNVLMGAVDMLDKKRIDLIEVEAGMNPRNPKHVPIEKFKAFLEARGYSLFGIYEQTNEFPTGESNIRRVNAVFISDDIIRANKLPYSA